MKPRRTNYTNRVFTMPGGTEDQDLWVYNIPDSNDNNVIASVWVPTAQERERIAKGENIRLLVWGTRMPPVGLDVTDEPLGREPKLDEVTP
jgi:hypothetical protein